MENETAYRLKVILFCLFIVTTLVSFGELIIVRDAEHEESLLHDNLQNYGTLIAQETQRKIANGIFATETLNTLLVSNNYDVSKFDEWGSQIVSISSVASCVQLAPDGIVTYVYPLANNRAAIGHDLLKDKRRDDGALKAIQSRELTFVGPVRLIQNGKYAVIARKPLFRKIDGNEQFWGFSIALLLIEDIISERISFLEEQGMHLKIEGDDPDGEKRPVLFASKEWDESDYIELTVDVPNGQWTIKLNHPPIQNQYYLVVRVSVFLFAMLLAIYIFTQQNAMHSKQREISHLNERLTELSFKDELTGVGNRRAAMYMLEQYIQQAKRYNNSLSIVLLDLDYFKEVNDRYGHPAGDAFLCHFTTCLNNTVRRSDSIFRLGGDEFCILFTETSLEKCLQAVSHIREYINRNPCDLDGTSVPIQFSIGIAEYKPGEFLESLLQRADDRLYEAKKAGRNMERY